ncbi:hypothetical protein Moror_2680 [Moniliophthora roreri MCA 2997]|uniref:Uncharacterized protein n=2 Tax=Moniliophthora roreri TaxID=221103 RepID=V2XF35_MONRO|nr:hypothetical protein Moror_2680 [Moniliophthora roreri MCA 2997]
MNSSGRDGKGPLQPHISNLPRRRPGKRIAAAPATNKKAAGRASSSSSTENASKTPNTNILHSSNRTNCSGSPMPQPSPGSSPSSSVSSSSTSSSSSSDPRNDNPLTGATTPSIPYSLALPKPKGHVQPHAHHMPRRRRPHLKLSPEEQRLGWREDWDTKKHKQEIVKGSGVWIAFDIGTSAFVHALAKGKHKVLSSEEEEDEADIAKREEFERYARETEHAERRVFKRIIRVETRPPLEAVNEDGCVREDDNTVRFFVPIDSLQDDGTPSLSEQQLAFAAKTFQELWSLDSGDSDLESMLIVTPRNRPVDAIALAVLAYSLKTFQHTSLPSPVANIIPQRPLTPPSLKFDVKPSSSPPDELVTPCSPVLAPTLPTSWLETSSSPSMDSPPPSPPAIVSVDPMTPQGAAQSPALAVLTRMHDLEDLKDAWRGVLSYEGVAYVNEVLKRVS